MTAPAGPVRPTVAVVILTLNEEPNLPHALDSVCGWADRVIVVDSFSTDRTVELARARGCTVVQHKFKDYGSQRNFAIDQVPAEIDWIFFLDADEWLTAELKAEIKRVAGSNPKENGYYVKRRFIWMGKWLRRGLYPVWILRFFRRGTARCEDRTVNEHLIVQGAVGRLEHDFIHDDRKPLADWVEKHNKYARREAEELLRTSGFDDQIETNLFGTQAERLRWLRLRVWNRMPPVVRPFAYFAYRYVARGGVLDGPAAFSYHFLQALWYPLLIDLDYLELRKKAEEAEAG